MSTTDNNPSSTVPDESQLNSAEGAENVGSTDTLSLSELSSYLGKSFTDKTTALKALKDTQSFVGKRKEDIEKEVRASLATSSSQNTSNASQNVDGVSKAEFKSLQDQLFFTSNPQFKGYESIIRRMGDNPAEVVELEEFKTIFENGKVAGEVAQRKSIVSSNSRLGQTQQSTTEAVRVANATRSTQQTAEALVKGIREEYEI